MAEAIQLHDRHIGQISPFDLVPTMYADYQEADAKGRLRLDDDIREYVDLARFAATTETPFCVEPNPYYQAPHAVLHELGHFAVKPQAYLAVYRDLSRRDYEVVMADVVIEPPYGDGDVIEGLLMYTGANDRVPDWDLPDGADPTPNEKAVRAWSREALAMMNMKDPIELGRAGDYVTDGTGDKVVGKAASYRTWAPGAAIVPRALDEMAAFRIDTAAGVWRPPADSLVLPHTSDITVAKLQENTAAMQEQYADRITALPEQMEDWRSHIAWKYGPYLG